MRKEKTMEKNIRKFKNESKIPQVFYNKRHDPILLKPGETYTEDISDMIDVNALVRRERERRNSEMDLEEAKRIKKALTMVRMAKTQEDLEKIREGEDSQDVLDAILAREKEILDG
jgi:hypothetical protein